ncbi:hypothetical protein SAMN02746065_101174 [Desulfocicer vacuolatum DSM 3385]|uniref:Uncharacterized protein n=1 Tax=Desulfocicer vacuolatum DSM 3385 TaxID=1121400 RepID=A0A1W1YMH2_9BACT|nr:hypothetical protein [Desulfocicer vacuolatum]SMC36908.1 hypothetical protein SAMN02746065_101174 [Desulfocicer vacuolatum DSM 3385]
MDSSVKKAISVKFQNSEVACRIIADLLALEREYPRAFFDTVGWIQEMFEKSHSSIGTATVMAGNELSEDKEAENVLPLNDFMARRFRNPDRGGQIIITLMELEARKNGSLGEIKIKVETTLKNWMARQASPEPAAVEGKIVVFKKNRDISEESQ